MVADEREVFVLELIVAVGPLALYFLALGLLNSRPHPYLMGLQTDFYFLSVAFFPLLVVPLAGLSARGWIGTWGGGVALLALVPWWAARSGLKPGWVIYNIDERRCRDAIGRACRRLGWEPTRRGDRIEVAPPGLEVRLTAFSLLRNVTLRITAGNEHQSSAAVERLGEALERELNSETLLPSPTGAALVLAGSALLAVPMGYLVHHMEAVVEAIRRIFLA